MTITKDDERRVREWLNSTEMNGGPDAQLAHNALALLDAPRRRRQLSRRTHPQADGGER